jgi:hypothetical protein
MGQLGLNIAIKYDQKWTRLVGKMDKLQESMSTFDRKLHNAIVYHVTASR